MVARSYSALWNVTQILLLQLLILTLGFNITAEKNWSIFSKFLPFVLLSVKKLLNLC
jgi:hypothetical protein